MTAQPLAGLRMVVTRAAHQAPELAKPLADLGAEVILLPTIGIGPPADPVPLAAAAARAIDYDWLFLTSVNAAEAFLPLVAPSEHRPRVGVVGAATSRRVAELGWRVDVTPPEFTAEALADALQAQEVAGKRILIPVGDLAREILPNALKARGAKVDLVVAYSNQPPSGTAARARSLYIAGAAPDWSTFVSPSAFDNLVEMTGSDPLRRSRIASIGPTTSAAVRARGLKVAAEPAEHTVLGLVAAIVEAVSQRA